jgi:hypothetical protein
MMDEKMKQEFVQMLREARGTPQEWSVIMAMVDMLEDDDEFEEMAELHKGIAEYKNYLTEKEARKIVDRFENFDGTRGAKWPSSVMFEAIERLGGRRSEKGRYNEWAMFVEMNNMHSDYGGVIMTLVQGDAYAKACYMMAVAKFNDRDGKHTIREYFGLE